MTTPHQFTLSEIQMTAAREWCEQAGVTITTITGGDSLNVAEVVGFDLEKIPARVALDVAGKEAEFLCDHDF
jgi:hypothetical protein